jgi:uncharacterized FAD-dependent dehydrogenase
MWRINELKLPLNHTEAELEAALLARLAIGKDALRGYSVFKRSYDARKRSAILLIYALDVAATDEAAILARLKHDAHVMPTPNTDYKFVARAEQLQGHDRNRRPVVVGTGPSPANQRYGGGVAGIGLRGLSLPT